eukprot:CAMPEP_0196822226 /NCGR_PEP_ID=MMETSP1362-20130617/82634_1 /TAXON_ID=163516 /ORGANISM="Leptocylindrus danicus, Strain CCMP1856" /LENGTH=736 /DNA_ID=CAMNT_0042201723 /DNA_START=96 /DNA_END=2307 /DNA_ORIENTATION=+
MAVACCRRSRSNNNVNRPHTNLANNEVEEDAHSLLSIHGAVEDAWQHRCRNLCLCMARSTCYLFGGREVHAGDYDQIARVLADYFEGLEGAHVDLVASDVVLGLVVLGKVQRRREMDCVRGLRHNNSNGSEANLFVDHTTALLSAADTSLAVSSGAASSRSNNHNGLRQRSRSPSNSAKNLVQLVNLHPTHNRPSTNIANTAPTRPLLTENGYDVQVIEEGARFARHALAIYTWMLYVYMKPCTGLCSLMSHRCFHMTSSSSSSSNAVNGGGCCCCVLCSSSASGGGANDVENHHEHEDFNNNTTSNTNNDHAATAAAAEEDEEAQEQQQPPRILRSITSDNICSMHEAALLKHAGLNQSELVYAQFQSSFTHTPYSITIDHKWRSVVLSIRGTLSFEDCVTDVLVDPVALEDFARRWQCDEQTFTGEFAHSGVISCSDWILKDLERHELLDQLLHTLANYTLRICGHSLGAGCAVLISFVLKQRYGSRLMRCLAYSPPGGLLTRKLATGCCDYVHSFVLDSDLVPRLSVQTMEMLRDEVLELIARIKVPKIMIAQSSLYAATNGDDSGFEEEDLECFLHPKDDIPDSKFKRQLERLKRVQQRRREEFRGPSVCLYPPGKIVHLIKVKESNSCVHGCFKCLTCGTTNFGSEYTPVWVSNDRFNEIVISPTMGTDHFPNRVCIELERIALEMFSLDVGRAGQVHARIMMGNIIGMRNISGSWMHDDVLEYVVVGDVQ